MWSWSSSPVDLRFELGTFCLQISWRWSRSSYFVCLIRRFVSSIRLELNPSRTLLLFTMCLLSPPSLSWSCSSHTSQNLPSWQRSDTLKTTRSSTKLFLRPIEPTKSAHSQGTCVPELVLPSFSLSSQRLRRLGSNSSRWSAEDSLEFWLIIVGVEAREKRAHRYLLPWRCPQQREISRSFAAQREEGGPGERGTVRATHSLARYTAS